MPGTRAAWATPRALAELPVLWEANKLTVAQIARRLHTTKNALVGKAHRMGLPAKPSPIIRSNTPDAIRCRLRVVVGHAHPIEPLAPLPSLEPALQPTRITPIPAKQTPAPIPHSAGRTEPCCWPLGTPGTTAFRYCDDASLRGKPYCQEHAALAYVKIRDSAGKAAHTGGGD